MICGNSGLKDFWLAPALLLPVCITAYLNSLDVPFQFDDQIFIVVNGAIHDAFNLSSIWSFNPARFLTFFTLAINWGAGGLDVTWYHIFNITVHFINSLLVFGLAKILSRSEVAPFPLASGLKRLFPYTVALLFVSHPIQTQAVTYIWQRNTSIATLFYLLSLYFYLKSAMTEGEKPEAAHSYFASSVVVACLAMFTKQICVTLPVAILIADWFFVSGSFAKLKERVVRLSAFLPALLIVPIVTVLGGSLELAHIDSAREVLSPQIYLLTQLNVLLLYLGLLFYPVGQNLDYDFPVSALLADSALSLIILLILLWLAIWMFQRNRMVSFGILFFFLAISVESSLLPLEDLVFEHRVYLPSVGFFLAITSITFAFAERYMKSGLKTGLLIVVTASLTLALTSMTIERNEVWRSKESLWRDVTEKSPNKARGYKNLASVYLDQKKWDLAHKNFIEALRRDGEDTVVHYALGYLASRRSDFDEAEKRYQDAIKLEPLYPEPHMALAGLYLRQKRYKPARKHFYLVMRLDPDKFPDARFYHVESLAVDGKTKEAIDALESALKQKINRNSAFTYGKLYKNLGLLYKEVGDETKAGINFMKAEKMGDR